MFCSFYVVFRVAKKGPMKYQIDDRATVTEVPEYNLVAAVIERARMDCIRVLDSRGKRSKPAQRIQDEARHWFFFSEDTVAFSFLWCCDALGLDPTVIRNTAAKLVVEMKG